MPPLVDLGSLEAYLVKDYKEFVNKEYMTFWETPWGRSILCDINLDITDECLGVPGIVAVTLPKS